jgi:hypothetical protein
MLLADFHIHTTWSDGTLSVREVVDLFGRSGHGVIAITDHVVNTDSLIGKIGHRLNLSVTEGAWDAYRTEIDRQAKYARDTYGMVVLAGCELTRNAFTGNKSAHALALGLDSFVSADGGVEEMLTRAREAGAVTVACHPNEQSGWFENTYYLWKRRREVGKLIDLWEVACRWDLFPPVAKAGLAYLANSDFHSPRHLFAWKTLADCEKSEAAVLSALRKGIGFGVTRLVSPVPVLPAFEPEPTPCGCLPDFAEAQLA